MPFVWASLQKRVDKMSLNTCKIILENAEQKTTTKGVSCTTDIELYVFILTHPR